MFEAHGRGQRYTRWRGVVEAALRLVYAGDWPARLWQTFPGATEVRVLDHRLALPAGRAPRAPLRVGFASDLHLGPTTPPRTLERAFRALADARLDVLALGGDYVFLDATQARADALFSLVRDVPARAKVAVLGNHDLWTHHGRLEQALERAGARVLINDALRLDGVLDDVALVGLDDPWTGRPDADLAFARAGDARVLVALCHAPDGLALVRGRGAALFLAGHTHGGHIALPGHRPILLPGGPLSRRFAHGLHDDDGTAVFVSRGLGGTEVPVRTYAPPDVAVFTLE